MSKIKVRSVYEQVQKNVFAEGFAYTSKEDGNYEVAVALQGVERSAFFDIAWIVEKRIKEIREVLIPLFADELSMIDLYQREIEKLQSFVDATKRIGL